MIDHFILHIGSVKTGSSALQSFFSRYEDELATAGLIYPRAEDHGLAVAGRTTSGNGAALARLFSDEEMSDDAVRKTAIDMMSVWHGERVLISSEVFEALRSDRVRLLADCLRRVSRRQSIVYMVRHVADHALSIYGDMVWQQGEKEAFLGFADRYQMPFLTTLDQYAEAFGAEALVSMVYDDMKEDLVGPFLDHFDISLARRPGAERVNRSLSRLELDVTRELLSVSQDPAFVRRLIREHAYQTRDHDVDALTMTDGELLRLEECWMAQIREVNQRFLTGEAKLNSCSDELHLHHASPSGQAISDIHRQLVDMLRAAVIAHDDVADLNRSH